MNSRTRIITKCFALFGLILAVSFFSIHEIVSAFADGLIIDRTKVSFVEGSFRYYFISGDSTGLAVAWVNNALPDRYVETNSSVSIESHASEEVSIDTSVSDSGTIQVPHSLTHDGVFYTVKAVAPGGFRNTGFTEVRLPETITQIGAEAFHGCESLTKFVIPCKVGEIESSTFMDCRALAEVQYSLCDKTKTDVTIQDNLNNISTNWKYWYNGSSDGYGTSNSTITSIGDHAFNSCIKLASFSFPTSLKNVGKSAFQNCQSFTYIMFVTKQNHATKDITIGEYAFADCGSMTLFFFANNVSNIGAYAFAQCERLVLYFSGAESDISSYAAHWRKKHVDVSKTDEKLDYVPFQPGFSDISNDPRYPGLYYATNNTSDILYDGWIAGGKDSPKAPVIHSKSIDANGYATILSFATPATSTTLNSETGYQYYNKDTGKLMLPNTVGTVVKQNGVDVTIEVPVRTIEQNAFLGNTDLKHIVFNSNLVQICKYAFYGCSNIETLDFDGATSLKAMSYKVFQDEKIEANTKLTELKIPKSMKIIGTQAFYGFRAVTSFIIPSDSVLETIGQQAFAYLGADLEDGSGTADIILPNTLSDGASRVTYHAYRLANLSSDNDNPLMREAFLGAKVLRTVKIAWNNSGAVPVKNTSIGISGGCFSGCTSLIRFTSSNYLYIVGRGAFSGCSALKELFLSTYGNTGRTWTSYPWGIDNGSEKWGGSLFDANTSPDLVIYVKETSPARDNAIPQSNGALWNTNSHIECANHTGVSDMGTYPTYPTYYGVDWTSNTAVQYRSLDKIGGNYVHYNIEEIVTISNSTTRAIPFDQPVFSYRGTTIVGTYFPATKTTANGTTSYAPRQEVDLTGAKNSNNADFTEIGSGAFAYGGANHHNTPGTRIYLPKSIATIGSYAFYRTTLHKIVFITYKDGENSTAVTPDDLTTYPSYCILSSSLTSIQRFAFYNHDFKYVEVKSNLSFYGNSAFMSLNQISSFSIGNQSTIAVSSDGYIYSVASGQKTLLYLYTFGGGENNATLDLTGSGLIAIGNRAMRFSGYSTVKVPSSLKTIYGGAFYGNPNLTEITIPTDSALATIGSCKNKPNDQGNFGGLPFDVMDYNFYHSTSHGSYKYYHYVASAGAFYNCSALTTFNFDNIQASALKRISFAAFRDCAALKHMTKSDSEYKYFKIEGGSPVSSETRGGSVANKDGVLDLSRFTQLQTLGRDAFRGCSNIKYIHLPNIGTLYVWKDNEEGYAQTQKVDSNTFGSAKVLVGRGAKVACSSSTDGSRDSEHYPGGCFNDKNTYYQATSTNDLIDNGSIKYWTTYGGGYLLFESRAEAYNYFEANS